MPKIRRKVIEIADKLESVLKWRILIETDMRRLQGKYHLFDMDSGIKFEYDMQISEELLYEMMWNLIYFYQFIRN